MNEMVQSSGKRLTNGPCLNGHEASAEAAGLRYVTDADPGIRRVRWGRGFRYLDRNGKPVADERTLARIRSLVIPPAWSDVWICTYARGHIQVTGRDDKGRKQYRYHPDWQALRSETKFERMVAFGQALPGLRRQVREDLGLSGLPKQRVLAVVVRLLDTTLIRIGNEAYAQENRSFGLTTFRDDHVEINGSSMLFHYRGKSGKEHEVAMSNRRLAMLVKRCQDLPGQVLFQYEDAEAGPQPIDSADVNDYLREIAGEDYTAKDFRTWAGSVLAAKHLRGLDPPETKTETNRQIVAAIDAVAERLGNTRAVCRGSYIHPIVFEAFTSRTIQDVDPSAHGLSRRNAAELDEDERFFLALLTG
jgi:DNA topoisomerase I